MILLMAALFGSAAPDSAVLAAADSLLQISDTVGALERLQSHADTSRVSLRLSDMLDRLVLPDSSDAWSVRRVDSSVELASAKEHASATDRPHWILAGQVGQDEGDDLPFWASTQIFRQSPWMLGKKSGHWEGGISQLVADASSDWLASGEAFARADLGWPHWLGSAQSWVGADQDANGEFGVAGSILRIDTSRIGRVAWGPEARIARNRSSWFGLTGRLERPDGLRITSALRWRQEPGLRVEQNDAVYEWATSRLQCQGAVSWLKAWGVWRFGPMVEADWRKSTQEDFWMERGVVVRPVRQESTLCLGGLFAVGSQRRWSVRWHPSWVFSRTQSLPVLEQGSDVEGLRMSIDGILVL